MPLSVNSGRANVPALRHDLNVNKPFLMTEDVGNEKEYGHDLPPKCKLHTFALEKTAYRVDGLGCGKPTTFAAQQALPSLSQCERRIW